MNARALAASLRALRAQVDALIIAVDGGADEPAEGPGCPFCGEMNPEKLEDTSESVFGGVKPRTTCLTCGKSWNHTQVQGEETSNG
jgi:hypothetical protein